MAKNNDYDNNAINLIGVGTEITGDVNSNGDIRIDGTLTGNLITKGKVVIGETGKVKGEVTCKNSDVSGVIDGKIVVSQLLSLKVSATVSGDIQTSRLAIEPGSKFTGNCNMNEVSANDESPKPRFEREIKQPEAQKADQ